MILLEHFWVSIITNKDPVTIGVVSRLSNDSTSEIDRFTDEVNKLFIQQQQKPIL